MDNTILPPSDTASHLAIQSLLSDLADVTEQRDTWREIALAALARLHSVTVALTRSTAAVRMLRREISRYTETTTIGRAA